MLYLRVDRLLQRLFFAMGGLVYDHKLAFALGPVLVAAACGSGLYYMDPYKEFSVEYEYSPTDGFFHYERATISEKWPAVDGRFLPGFHVDSQYWTVVCLRRRDKGNMFNMETIKEIRRINDHIGWDIELEMPDERLDNALAVRAYRHICMRAGDNCFRNPIYESFEDFLEWRAQGGIDQYSAHLDNITSFGEVVGNKTAQNIRALVEGLITFGVDRVDLTFPVSRSGNAPVPISNMVTNVKYIDDQGHFNYFDGAQLVYSVTDKDALLAPYSKVWQRKVHEYVMSRPSQLLDIAIMQNDTILNGLHDVMDTFMPNIVSAFGVLFAFALVCSTTLLREPHVRGVDWARSKHHLAGLGMATATLGIITSFGILMWAGAPFNPISFVAPFLLYAIGVDDMFIMVAAWHRTDPEDSARTRMQYAMSEAAVSITITSTTDLLSFVVGLMNTIKAAQLFCQYAALGVLCTYLHHVTFFAACMAYFGQAESEGRHNLLPCIKTYPVLEIDKSHTIRRWLQSTTDLKALCAPTPVGAAAEPNGRAANGVQGERKATVGKAHEISAEKETYVAKFFRNIYGPFLLHPATKAVVLALYAIVIGVSIYLASQIAEGFKPRRFLLPDDRFNEFLDMMNETFWDKGELAHVVVNNAPNLMDKEQVALLEQLHDDFGHFEKAFEPYETVSFLRYWLGEVEQQSAFFDWPNMTVEEYYARLDTWMWRSDARDMWSVTVHWLPYRQVYSRWHGVEPPPPPATSTQLSTSTDSSGGFGSFDNYDAEEESADPLGFRVVSSFRLLVPMADYRPPEGNKAATVALRAAADRWTQFNVTTNTMYGSFADRYIIIVPTTVRNVLVAIACMVAVALVMIPSLSVATVVGLAVVAIDIMLLAAMHAWGMSVDIVTMTTIIMSTGFSVDLTAHMCYAYVCATGSHEQKAVHALETLGWPVFQGGLSTVLGMLVLSRVRAYLIQAFFVTVFVTIVAGLLHSLVIIPIVLTIIFPLIEAAVERCARLRGGTANAEGGNGTCVIATPDSRAGNCVAPICELPDGRHVKRFGVGDSISEQENGLPMVSRRRADAGRSDSNAGDDDKVYKKVSVITVENKF